MTRLTKPIVLIGVLLVVLGGGIAILPPLMQSTQPTPTPDLSLTTISYLERYADVPHSRTADGGFVLGDPDAPVTIVEFADFMCPHCQSYHEVVMQFVAQYVVTGKAKLEYRLYPIVNPTYSEFTAKLAECVDIQQPGLFWAAHDVLYDLQGNVDAETTTRALAGTLALDLDTLALCVDTATQYETDLALGTANGVNGTPTIMIRLDDDTLAFPYLSHRVLSQGGLPLGALENIVNAESLADVSVVWEGLLDHLLIAGACNAPCWNGITPGVTDWDSAKRIIEDDRQFINLQEEADEDGAKALFWYSLDGLECCRMLTETGESVDEVFLLAADTVRLGDVFRRFGEPAYALARETQSEGLLANLIYPDHDMVLYVFVEGGSVQNFSGESPVVGVSHLSETRMMYVIEASGAPIWAGFDGLPAYRGF